MSGNVTNVVFRNSTCIGTNTGARIKSMRGRGGLVANITYEDFVLTDVDQAIYVTLQYQNVTATNASATPTFKDIFINNYSSTNTISGAGQFICLPESPCFNITLSNVMITDNSLYACLHAYGRMANVNPSSCLLPGP